MPPGTCKGVPGFQSHFWGSNKHFTGRSLPQKG